MLFSFDEPQNKTIAQTSYLFPYTGLFLFVFGTPIFHSASFSFPSVESAPILSFFLSFLSLFVAPLPPSSSNTISFTFPYFLLLPFLLFVVVLFTSASPRPPSKDQCTTTLSFPSHYIDNNRNLARCRCWRRRSVEVVRTAIDEKNPQQAAFNTHSIGPARSNSFCVCLGLNQRRRRCIRFSTSSLLSHIKERCAIKANHHSTLLLHACRQGAPPFSFLVKSDELLWKHPYIHIPSAT
ncbi:unnamed protein product [Lactuca virosa]|uniref:Uncharacterized protein n=1 Tax=Lactuca virosa TaxID=75947 RepID=A0AAU9NK34_9ASTR|nr:unnamed protein product [Lactuca virosa]